MIARTLRRRNSPRARVDQCWLLTDGSVAVDGWFVEPDGVPGTVEARTVQGAATGAWSPLLRKERSDVATHVLGDHAGASGLGVVGYVAGPVDPEATLSIEIRGRGWTLRLPVEELRRDDVPEEVFAGLVLDYATLTPAVLAPVVGVVRSSAQRPLASAMLRYEYLGTGAARVGVVVPVYRNLIYLRNLLRTLADAPGDIDLTLVCDDPELTDELVDWVRAWNDSVYQVPLRVLAHDRNAGFSAACNTGWRATTAQVVLLLNSDVLVADPVADPDRLADALTGDVAATAPVLLFPDGTLQHAGMEMVDAPDFPGFVLPAHPGKHGPADALPTEPFEVPMLTGAAMCVRREVLDAVGGVPSVYGRGDFEDVILSLSLRDRGRLVVDPRVRWTHMEGASYRRDELGGIAVTLAKSVVVGERTGWRR